MPAGERVNRYACACVRVCSAHDISHDARRQTVTPQDVMSALHEMELDVYMQPCKAALDAMKSKRDAGSAMRKKKKAESAAAAAVAAAADAAAADAAAADADAAGPAAGDADAM